MRVIEKQLTVKELIEILQALPPDTLVETEGCDCWGPCVGAVLVEGKTRPASRGGISIVLLERGR